MKHVSESEWERVSGGYVLLEADGFGPKVYRDEVGSGGVKLFRRKRWLSSQLWSPHARRFQQNADALRRKGFLAPEVMEVWRIPHLMRDAVYYKWLKGSPLRQFLGRDGGECILEQLPGFLARLHDAGILFRSIHFGNIFVGDSGELGLIDVVDLRVVRRRNGLSLGQRLRNFRHLLRYPQDRTSLMKWGWERVMEQYLMGCQAGRISRSEAEKLTGIWNDLGKDYQSRERIDQD